MEQGIYEQLITESLKLQLNSDKYYIAERKIEPDEAALWLANFLAKILSIALENLPRSGNSLKDKLEFTNQLMQWVDDNLLEKNLLSENLLDTKGRILTALLQKENPIAADLEAYAERIMPLTGLSESELFCGNNSGLSLESEIKREILSADEIYLLVSFIKWTGIRIFKDELESFTKSGRKLKVITTSYMGATDFKAVQFLAGLPNTEVKLSYNTSSERLHAKSYLFKRKTGFDTGYIGSSNLSHSALTNGLEWNLKVTSQEIPHILKKSLDMFEVYWNSSDFEVYDGSECSEKKLRISLSNEGGSKYEFSGVDFDINPYPHQKEVLERLTVERQLHGRFRNLIVAATGTGKTLISAFDFSRYYRAHPQAKFLFVAHRQEILQQALSSYRSILRDKNWGALWFSGESPTSYDSLFASVQSLKNNLSNGKLSLTGDFYDFIVVDEVHHIAANSYREILSYFKPKILLGLTATPERHDGLDILDDFHGVIAAEIRLPEAINQRILTPFHYFMIYDDTNLASVNWNNGRYDQAELSRLYRQDPVRTKHILQAMTDILTDVSECRALAFCVDREHAEFMVNEFLKVGLKAGCLTSNNSHERDLLRRQIRMAEINILCVVDMFNEGVDIPEIDTLLFLRPTESLTVFLQQLGRGLRLTMDKDSCTVLDFVGNSRSEYDFSSRLRALIGKTKKSIKEEVENGFPHLPSGCNLVVEEKAKAQILNNIRAAVFNLTRLKRMLVNFKHQTDLPLTLSNFLKINPQVTIEDIYKVQTNNKRGWNQLVDSVLSGEIQEPEVGMDLTNPYGRAIYRHIMSCNSMDYLKFLKTLCCSNFDMPLISKKEKIYGIMTHYAFWGKPGLSLGFSCLEESLRALKNEKLQAELVDVIDISIGRIEHVEIAPDNIFDVPLFLHSRYSREQIFTAYGLNDFESETVAFEGVISVKNTNTELLFVTLDKTEKHFSPTVMYHDYAVTETLFHWQTQNSARPDRGRGKDYIQQAINGRKIILFVREKTKDLDGRTMAFVNLGCVNYVSHSGSKPMNITWELEKPMPAFIWHAAAKLSLG
ncbi:DUF3427 domain-containing protein [Oceanobacter sp. 3_MG-2023]|uniref:DUF3427 domain-containing protein n=1 Tax=Oceanobacter sp. 3_MG-2023 TaxID=3062622 RepID=UPI002735EC31|nr:DEAD/DEAH box helicase [Oceanobacter sp. 3_MG-2023]MDP2504644.1 DUF3427 domain-containing protein [Oceanobacter sp. 3_MG-2023]